MTGDRTDLIDKLLWNNGGTGFGICAFANSMSWTMSKPKEPHGSDDLKSIVAVSGPPDKYTDEELQTLVAFSERRTADYDKMYKWRLGANLICIDKYSDNNWLRKRLSWDRGPMYSPTLSEALAVFEVTETREQTVAVSDPDHLNPAKGGNRASDDYW